MGRYADIVLPLAGPAYTFAVDGSAPPEPGSAVAVQFGARGYSTGIVWRIHDNPPAGGRVKSVVRTLYDTPLLSPLQMRFWEWMADYYMCTLGEVMRMALPSEVKPRAEQESGMVGYRPRRICFVRLAAEPDAERSAYMQRRAPKQYAVVSRLREAGGALPRSEFSESSALSALCRAGITVTEEREVAEPAPRHSLPDTLPALSPAQERTLAEIGDGFSRRGVVLLRGVTSSGKTEIYMHLIDAVLRRGGDVLYLVPEISLTPQLVERLRRTFGDAVTVYHSGLTPSRRTKTYMGLLRSDGGNVVVGARSAVFLPLRHLGLVVVDEEHDASYKQSEPSPRYNGRDSAVMLASLHGAECILGSATPSLESYANLLSGKYAGATLSERYGGILTPRITVSDTLRSAKRGERRLHFNRELLDAVALRLERGEQTMLLQNRRGYSPFVECTECGWTARCPRCNVSLTRHLAKGELVCHYCGYSMPLPRVCPECGHGTMEDRGFGTERIEDDIASIFPQARVLRLDGDTATSGAACARIVSAFSQREADILVGTRIISKGLDFDGVTLIGILNADNLLNTPDFRAGERAWQFLMQAAGRCGRRSTRGEVIIQTSEPSHPLFRWLGEEHYESVAAELLEERRIFSYPPYARLVRITLRSTDTGRLASAARTLDAALRARLSGRVFGPASPLVDRVRDEYILEITVKIESSASMSKARGIIREETASLRSRREMRGVKVICDVDFQ